MTSQHDSPINISVPLRDESTTSAAELRERAEAVTRTHLAPTMQLPLRESLSDQVNWMAHELDVHHIELEMQNDELRRMVAELDMQNFALRRKQSEIDAAQARYFDFYDLAPVGYITLNTDGLVLQANLTTASWLQLPRNMLLERAMTRFIHNDDQDIFYLLKKTTLNTNEPQSKELRLIRRDGTPCWMQLDSIAAKDDENTPILRLVLNDITERRQAGELLRESEFRYRQLIKELPVGVVLQGPQTEVLLANSKALELLGVTESQFIGKTSLDQDWIFTHEDGSPLPGPQHPVSVALLTRQPVHDKVMSVYRTKTQDRIWLMVNADLQFHRDGSVQQVVCAFYDITERYLAKAAQEEALNRLQKVTSRVPGMVYEYRLRPDGHASFPFASEGIQDIYGVRPRDVLQDTKQVRTMIHPQDAEGLQASIQQSALTLNPWRHEYRVKSADDTVRWLMGQALPQREPDGGTLWHGLITDITAKHEQEQKRLRHEAAHRDTLVREVHHRIKNNLQGITGLLNQFAQKQPDTAQALQEAIGQVHGIAAIHGLQGRPGSNGVKLCELTRAIAEQAQSLWQTPVKLDTPANGTDHTVAEREAVPIALVLNELILNAVKHGGKNHGQVNISIKTIAPTGLVEIEIVNAMHHTRPMQHPDMPHSGLQLVQALMPPHGAKLTRAQHGAEFVSRLELASPIISIELKDHP